MENISTAVHGQRWISLKICMSLWSSWPVMHKASKWWWWSGIDGLHGCNILIAHLIDYDDNVMAEHTVNIMNFCVHSRSFTARTVSQFSSLVQMKQTNQKHVCMSQPTVGLCFFFFFSLTSYKHFTAINPFLLEFIALCSVLFVLFWCVWYEF